MKIKTLNLYAFGKFKNTTIELSDGFNLIFGPNEAGKSTIQAFIEGMFFGFYKPYRKRRTYSDDYERYRPLHNDKYYGSIIIEDHTGREIRIERDFLQERDGVRIFDNITGEDISETYPYDPVTKQYMPLGYDAVNASVYNNTVNFKQMATRSDEDLAAEINSRLVNMAGAQAGDISVTGVLDYLAQKKEAIGTFRRSQSNYGMAVRKRDAYEEALDLAQKKYQRIRTNQKRILQYQDRLTILADKQSKLEAAKRDREQQAVDAQRRKVEAVRDEGEKLQNQIDALTAQAAYYNPETDDQLRLMAKHCEDLARRKTVIQEETADVKNQLEEAARREAQLSQKLSGIDEASVADDWALYRQCTGQPLAEDETAEGRAARPFIGGRGLLGINPFVWGGLVLIGIVLLVVALLNPNAMLNFGSQFFLSALGLAGILAGGGLLMVHRLGLASSSERQVQQAPVASAEPAEADWLAAQIMATYGQRHRAGFERIMKRLIDAFEERKLLKKQLTDLRYHMDRLADDEADCDEAIQWETAAIQAILSPLGLDSIEAYRAGAGLQEQLRDLQAKRQANAELYESLSGEDYVRMPRRSDLFETDRSEDRKLAQSMESVKREIASLEGENQTLAEETEAPVVLKEKIEALNDQIEAYETELKACDMAEAFFNQYQKESHYMQAGDLNQKIGDILGKITHKYHEVKVDDQLNIRVVSPGSGALIDLKQLSGGTIDQIYFALRFGVRDIVDRGRNLPFILDDPFVQYDDVRKKAAIQFLNRVSEDDQVLLFTCSSDEKNIMDEAGMPYIGIGI
jgi:hypothetical protein